jgi:hypothetical protein
MDDFISCPQEEQLTEITVAYQTEDAKAVFGRALRVWLLIARMGCKSAVPELADSFEFQNFSYS